MVDKIVALKPDLILDYGTIAPRYVDLAKATQQRTGIPTLLLDGSLAEIPRRFARWAAFCTARNARRRWPDFARGTAGIAEAAGHSVRVVCARGADGLTLVAPGTDLAETFTRAGWQLVAPAGQGPSRQATLDDIRALDPDVLVFTDPAMRTTLAQSEAWQSLRAVREGHAFVAPNMPFGWLDEPPSINRLLGLAWLGGSDPRTLAALFNAVVYGRALTAPQLDALVAGVHPLQP